MQSLTRPRQAGVAPGSSTGWERAQAGRLHQIFETTCDARPDNVAVVCEDEEVTYGELDRRSNRLARHLALMGVRPGVRVGLVMEPGLDLYTALLGVLKAEAAYVPIDPSTPVDRLRYIAEDARLGAVVTNVDLQPLPCQAVDLRDPWPVLPLPDGRPPGSDEPADPDAECYVIYTSGSTGRPKGVRVSHRSICHFVEVATGLYGIEPSDRVYQGMTLSFDFSVEEIWPAWAAGAAVVPGPKDERRLGAGLARFIADEAITVLFCVPTLLATVEEDLPSVRLLVVGAESCPMELVRRWSTQRRRMLNTYGPTEATVTATCAELSPDTPVTLGRPIPGYRVEVLDEHLRPVPAGEVGEICIGGPGVALGYLNLPEKTAECFVTDPRSGDRLYRSGDLARNTASDELEFLGRRDEQVKIRGYRVDLAEIESLLLADDAVAGAAVWPFTAGPGEPTELVAYVAARSGIPESDLGERLHQHLRQQLPAYMVPAFIEFLDSLPTSTGGKVAHNRLPPPSSSRRISSSLSYRAPDTPMEKEIADVWAGLFGLDQVSTEADFFRDLGGHSLYAARAVSILREHAGCQSVSLGDIYAYPTVGSLAGRLATLHDPVPSPASERGAVVVRSDQKRSRRAAGAAATQAALIYFLLGLLGGPLALVLWAHHGSLSGTVPLQAAVTAAGSVIVLSILLPPLVVRVLTGGLHAGRYRKWGPVYLRWWAARKILSLSPLPVLAGSPLAPAYLRLLGATVGRRCHIGTARIDLPRMLNIGDDASIGYAAALQPFVLEADDLWISPIRIGDRTFVGANAVIGAGATMGAGARLAEQSLLAQGQSIPPGEHWEGSPAGPSRTGDSVLDQMEMSGAGERGWAAPSLVLTLVGLASLELLPWLALIPPLLVVAWGYNQGGAAGAVIATLVGCGPAYVLGVSGLVAATRRVLSGAADGVHPARSVLGVRKWFADKLLEVSLLLTNTLYGTLYTTVWLRMLGARVGRRAEVSTVAHIDPDLLQVGTECFLADLASVGGATYHAGAVAFGRTELGRRSFVGNSALVRSGSRLGEDSLVGVHTVLPRGRVVDGATWLGSPPISLPQREPSGDFPEAATFRPPRHKIAERLAIEYFRVTLPGTLLAMSSFGMLAVELYLARRLPLAALLAVTPALILSAGLAVLLAVALLKWAIVGRYRPRVEPLWDRFVRRTELVTGLYEAAAVPALITWLTGTPMMGPALRLLGARIGRRTAMWTTYLTEFDLVEVGDDAVVGDLTSLQTHLFEDRVMKMSRLRVGPGATVGSRSVVLYDAEVAPEAILDSLSLLMKGERLPSGTRWRGIPAQPATTPDR